VAVTNALRRGLGRFAGASVRVQHRDVDLE
jgi:hypothetical protein